MRKRNGKYLENIVHILEKSLNPDSTVLIDQKLPVISSRIGAKTQCDVVIVSGKKPRQTLTIVEVQDRSSKPTANDFRGWEGKLKEVGAQHLICVSRKGFTRSTIDKARNSNGQIRLIKLSDYEPSNIPVGFFDIRMNFENFNISKIKIKAGIPKEVLNIIPEKVKGEMTKFPDIDKRCYSFNDDKLINIFTICRDKILSNNPIEPKGISILEFPIDSEMPLFFHYKEIKTKIDLKIEVEWTYSNNPILPTILSYDQDEHGVLAWFLEFIIETQEGVSKLRSTVLPNGKGYILKNIQGELQEGFSISMQKFSKK